MTIGKRKGYTAKGAGAQPGNEATKKVGGSLSKSDHFYLQEAFGVGADPGAAPQPWVASGGIVSDYVEPGPGNVYRSHLFTGSGTFAVTAVGSSGTVDYLIIAGGGGGGGAYEAGGGGAGGYRATTPEGPGGPSPNAENAYAVSVGNYTVTVGGGGNGGVNLQ